MSRKRKYQLSQDESHVQAVHGQERFEFSKDIADQFRKWAHQRQNDRFSTRKKLILTLRLNFPDQNTLNRYKPCGMAILLEDNEAVVECNKFEAQHALKGRKKLSGRIAISDKHSELRAKRRFVTRAAESRWHCLVVAVFPPTTAQPPTSSQPQPQPQHVSTVLTSPATPMPADATSIRQNYSRTITLEWSDSSEGEHEEGEELSTNGDLDLAHKKQRKH